MSARSALLLSLALSACSAAAPPPLAANEALQKTHAKITKDFTQVPHISAQKLSEMDEAHYVIFDVREADEFAVSHLKNAVRLDPDISAKDFYSQYGEPFSGKTIILYCSVGVRSARLAKRLLGYPYENHTAPIYNLENGIFGWHNEGRPLAAQSRPTDFVHPYNRYWGSMVNRKDLQRYTN